MNLIVEYFDLFVVAALAAFAAAWLKGLLNEIFPSPARALLFFRNLCRGSQQRPDDGFRIVLCWLEDDSTGEDTRNVARAFTSVEGVELLRSSRMVAASGASRAWSESMRAEARSALNDWNADLAIVGLVKTPGEAVSLWFVARSGEDTLTRGDRPYKLEDVTLGADFHDDLEAQLTAVALSQMAPFGEALVRGRVLEQGLRSAAEKLSRLIEEGRLHRAEHRAGMQVALGTALLTLGERETGTARLEQSADAFREALKVFTREQGPEVWGLTLSNLGIALVRRGEREGGTTCLEEAVEAFQASLEEGSREQAPLDWATTQSSLGSALTRLGEREPGTARLQEAVVAYRAAVEVRTRERMPLLWAETQNNLAVALATIGERENSQERLVEAEEGYRIALKERTRERVPLHWAETNNNLGAALAALGRLEGGTERLKEAVSAYREALRERTRERVPLQWALTKNNLGNALLDLAERENSAERRDEAVTAYRKSLEELATNGPPRYRHTVQRNLDRALKLSL